jgi:hypothetical protein
VRSLLFGTTVVVLMLANFGPSAAHKIYTHRRIQSYYSACVCRWGHVTDNSGNACTVAVSCNAEGGRCVRSCPPIRISQVKIESAPPATSVPESTPSTADLARKCDGLTAKAFPQRQPGNPAAGTAKGSGSEIQSYFKKCMVNGGRTDESTDSH